MTEFSFPVDGNLSSGDNAAECESRELVDAARHLDGEAWEEIYTRNHPRVYRYIQARVGDPELAEDLAATVFLEAVKRIQSYQQRGRPMVAWLYGIARNLTNQHHRSNMRRREIAPEQRLGDGEETPLPAPSRVQPEAEIDAWDVREAVLGLSTDQREALVLRFFAGLTTPEVAIALGKNERAVYSLYTRGIQALKRRLGEDFMQSPE